MYTWQLGLLTTSFKITPYSYSYSCDFLAILSVSDTIETYLIRNELSTYTKYISKRLLSNNKAFQHIKSY